MSIMLASIPFPKSIGKQRKALAIKLDNYQIPKNDIFCIMTRAFITRTARAHET